MLRQVYAACSWGPLMAILCGLGGLLQLYWGHLPAILPGLVSNTAHLELSWPTLPLSSVILGPSWPHLGRLGRVINCKNNALSRVFCMLSESGFLCFNFVILFHVGPSRPHLGRFRGDLGVSEGSRGPSEGHLGCISGPSWAHLGQCWATLGTMLGNLGLSLGACWRT